MPSLYNSYEEKTLHSKFCKDKQNKTSKTDLIKTWLTRNSIFTVISYQSRTNDENYV